MDPSVSAIKCATKEEYDKIVERLGSYFQPSIAWEVHKEETIVAVFYSMPNNIWRVLDANNKLEKQGRYIVTAKEFLSYSFAEASPTNKLPFKAIIPRKDGNGFIGRVLTEEVTIKRTIGMLDIADSDQANGRPLTARVLMVSEHVLFTKVGDIVHHSRQIASSFSHNGVKYSVIEENNIFGYIDETEMPINE